MKKILLKIKRWWVALLVSLGLIATPLLYAEIVDFTYTPASTREDGTALPPQEIAETRLYCDGSLVDTELGADGVASPDLGLGVHTCYGTHVDTSGLESAPSNTVTRTVLPSRPLPPVMDP